MWRACRHSAGDVFLTCLCFAHLPVISKVGMHWALSASADYKDKPWNFLPIFSPPSHPLFTNFLKQPCRALLPLHRDKRKKFSSPLSGQRVKSSALWNLLSVESFNTHCFQCSFCSSNSKTSKGSILDHYDIPSFPHYIQSLLCISWVSAGNLSENLRLSFRVLKNDGAWSKVT